MNKYNYNPHFVAGGMKASRDWITNYSKITLFMWMKPQFLWIISMISLQWFIGNDPYDMEMKLGFSLDEKEE